MLWDLILFLAVLCGGVWALRWCWRTQHTAKSATSHLFREIDRFMNKGAGGA